MAPVPDVHIASGIHSGFIRCLMIWILWMVWLVLGCGADSYTSSGLGEQGMTWVLRRDGDAPALTSTPLPMLTQSVSVVTSTPIILTTTSGRSAALLLSSDTTMDSMPGSTRMGSPIPTLGPTSVEQPPFNTVADIGEIDIATTTGVEVPGVGNFTVGGIKGAEAPNYEGGASAPRTKGWGFGSPGFDWTTCLSQYDNYLDGSTEMDKWASGVATTLMTVLPSMIAFSPLKTADIQTLYYLDVVVAVITCGFTLFFGVGSWTTLQKDKVWNVTDLLDNADIGAIYSHRRSSRQMRTEDNSISDPISPTPSSDLSAIRTGTGIPLDRGNYGLLTGIGIDSHRLKRLYERGGLEKLQQDALGACILPDEVESGTVTNPGILNRRNGRLKQPRPLRIIVYMVITAFCIFQFFLFLVMSCWVFRIDSTLFIWSCAENGYVIFLLWVAGSFISAAVVRYVSSSSWTRADEIFHVENIPTTPDCCEDTSALFNNSIEGRNSHSNWGRIKLVRFWSNLMQLQRLQGLPGLVPIMLKTFSIEWERLGRPHPMVLVIRPSHDPCEQRVSKQWLSGYLQVLHLGGVSFLFGSIALSSLFLTLGFVATFVSAVAFSRLASIKLCTWLETRLGLTIIEYRTEEEWVAIWVVLNSMPGCLVESKNSSYRYANGYRPHLCAEASEDPGTTAGANPSSRGGGEDSELGSIPISNTDMLRTTTQVPDVKTICTFCSIAVSVLLAISVGTVSGTLCSYALVRRFSIEVASIFGGTLGAISFLILVWRFWTEFESAAGYGQALKWARGFNLAK